MDENKTDEVFRLCGSLCGGDSGCVGGRELSGEPSQQDVHDYERTLLKFLNTNTPFLVNVHQYSREINEIIIKSSRLLTVLSSNDLNNLTPMIEADINRLVLWFYDKEKELNKRNGKHV